MQARCPHCTSVFTTDQTGVQFCPSCGRQINVPAAAAPGAPEGGFPGQLPPPPGPGAPPPGGALPPGGQGGPVRIPGPTPWERRKELGFWRGYGQTLKQSMFSPEEFWSSVRPDGPIGDPILFSWLTAAITFAVSALPMYAVSQWYLRVLASTAGIPPEMRRLMEGGSFGAIFFGWLVGGLLLSPLFVIIAAAIIHLLLLITGGAKGGFSATVRAICYAAGPQLISFIPLVGTVGSVYAAVLMIWGLIRLHRSDWWRPVLSFALLFAFCCCCWVLVVAGASMAGQAARH